jgi:glycosyltransferase involved in cell wall biosynthesis
MKIRLISDKGDWGKSVTGKGHFIARLIPHLEELGAEMVYETKTHVDIDMQLGYIHYDPINCKRFIVRMGPAFVSTHQDYKKLNKPKKWAIQQADGVIYQSQFGKKMCDAFLGKACCKTAVIFNGAERKATFPTYPPNWLVLACAREWTGQKRLDQIIDAFLLAGVEQSRLNIIGKTKLKEKDERVVFHGKLPEEKIDQFYANSKVVIDIGYAACCDNVVCEALANNCMVITSSESGNAELVNDTLIIKDEPWNFKPLNIMKPPRIDVAVLAWRVSQA